MSSAWMADVLDHVGIGVFVVDQVAQEIVQANDACARMVGRGSGADLVGRDILELYPDPKERAEIQARLLANPKFRETGRARLQVRRIRQDTREVIDLSVALQATFGADGGVTRLECVIEELGGPRVDERAFRLSEERFRVLFDTNQAGMVLTDLEGHVTLANPAFCSFTGRTASELLGSDLYEWLDVRPSPSDGGFALGERRFVRPDGEEKWGLVTGSWLGDGDASPHSAVVVIQDVTEKKKTEQTLQRIAKLESLGLLAGGIAHDFNNLLATVQVALDAVERRPLDDEGRELVQAAGVAAQRAAGLARELLTFAKGGTPARRVTHLAPLLRETASLCERGSRVRIELDIAENLSRCAIDVGQINQVLHNLFVNAIQSMPDGGCVKVEARNASDARVCVSVIDEGTGILPEHLDRIFDPYFTTKSTGSGLGLAIAHSIVSKHGGLLTAENGRDRGSIFRIYLPATDCEADVVVDASTASMPRPGTRVLVMDDEDNLRKLTLRLLRHHEVDAVGARDGAEALELYREALHAGRPFDALLLDLTIRGGMGGEQTFAELRALDPGVRAIVVSGYTDSRVLSDWRAHGFAGAVMKPFQPETLLAAIVSATESLASPSA